MLTTDLYKSTFKIGLVPEKLICQYFEYYYFPQFKFFPADKAKRKVVTMQMVKDDNFEVFGHQKLVMDISKAYYYTQVMHEL